MYLLPTSYYKLNGNSKSIDTTPDTFTSGEVNYQQYSVIQLTTNKSWTYGLTVETVEFDVYLSSAHSVDMDITISALENAQNYNSSQDIFFYHKTLSFNEEYTHVTLEINDIFVNKEGTFSLEFDTSCYTANPELKISVNNFKMKGFHQETNY